jgi:hypothetical protein
MEQIIILPLLLSNGQTSGHDQEDFEYTIENNIKIITLNFRTLYVAMQMADSKFEELMGRYEYYYDEGKYVSKASARGPGYLFKKKPGEVTMMWVRDSGFCTYLKEQLKKLYIKTEDGTVIYGLKEIGYPAYIDIFMLEDYGEHGFVTFRQQKENQPPIKAMD